MTTFIRSASIAALGSVLAVLGLNGLRAESTPAPAPAPEPREVGYQIVPDRVFRAIVIEANGYIQEQFNRPTPQGIVCQPHPVVVRANALLIALAAQNRMNAVGTGSDAAKLATLRDAAVNLAGIIERGPPDSPEIRKCREVLNKFPDIDPNPKASLALIRLNGPFNHDDVGSLFGGCSGNKTQRLEYHLMRYMRPATPLPADALEKVELLAYKLALVTELLRDMSDFLPTQSKNVTENRKLWVKFATDVHAGSWDLVAALPEGNVKNIKQSMTKLTNQCAVCHEKFRQ